MANQKTSDYSAITSLQDAYLFDVANPSTANYKITAANLKADVLSSPQPNRSESSTVNTTATDNQIFISASGGDVTVNLQNVSKIAGRPLKIIRTDSNISTKILLVPESGNINGAASKNMPNPYQITEVFNDGTNWFIN